MITSLRSQIKHNSRLLLNLILPPRCPMTGELVGEHGTLDPHYWGKLNFIQSPLCSTCGSPFPTETQTDMVCGNCLQDPPTYKRARSIWRYDDTSTGMVLKFKHADGTQLAPLFAGYLQQCGHDILQDADLLIPVPLHRWRLLKRRYNQAALLTRALSKKTSIPHLTHALRRIRSTAPQGHKTHDQRIQNIAHAFSIPEKIIPLIRNKKLVLVDDVFTSGATVNECVKTLLSHGAASVDVLTLAKVVRS